MDTEETQQEILSRIVNKYIAPTMKELGFKRKGRRFRAEGQTCEKELNVLSSRWNTRDDVSFTLELFVRRGGENTGDQRVGALKTGKDTWYQLNADVLPDELGRTVKKDIVDYAIPFFDRIEFN